MMFRNKIIMVFIIILLAGILTGADYPTDKGAFTVGGRLSLAFGDGDLYGDFSDALLVDVNADFQQFSWPHLAWGMSIGVSHVKYGNSSASLVAIGPLLAYYLGGKDSKYYPFVMASFRVGRISLNGLFDDDDAVTYEYGGSLGLARFISRSVAITASLDYIYEDYDYDKAKEVFSEARLGFSLGFRTFIY
jgi:hypothetical protein